MLLVVVVALVATSCDSRDMPDIRSQDVVVITLGRVNGSSSGNVGVDGFMWKYNPCFDHRAPNEEGLPDDLDFEQDPFFGACALPSISGVPQYNSYVEYVRWTGNNAGSSGIWLGNSTPCRDDSVTWCFGGTLNHGWARKWTRFALEFYPDDPNASGVRLEVACCPGTFGSFALTENIGDVTLPTPSTPGTTRLQGSVAGVSGADQVGIDVFQIDEFPAAHSSGGAPLYSFASTHNGKGTGNGSWAVPAVYNGEYVVYVTDKAKPSRKVVVRFNTAFRNTVDVNRNQPCFGLTGVYDPATWYLNDELTPGECAALWS